MKQIHPDNYDSQYFTSNYLSPNYDSKLKPSDFSRKYQEISKLSKLKPSDTIVDFGCGNGDLCFYLALTFGCKCIGIDYSKTAIDIAKQNLSKFNKNFPDSKIKFYNRNNNHLPKLKKISAIYMTDVVEHMYDHEIKKTLKVFKQWGTKLQIIVHTDNNIYLQYIHPIIYTIQWFLNPTLRPLMLQNKRLTHIMHINLTTPKVFTKKMELWGFGLQSITFPGLTPNIIKNQIGIKNLSPIISRLIIFTLSHLTIFFPSFYAIYFPVTATDN